MLCLQITDSTYYLVSNGGMRYHGDRTGRKLFDGHGKVVDGVGVYEFRLRRGCLTIADLSFSPARPRPSRANEVNRS